MPSVIASGTYTLTGSEVTIGSTAQNYTLVVRADLSNLAAGDVVTLRAKESVLQAGAVGAVWEETFSGAQVEVVKHSIPFSAPHGASLTAIQTAGTFRQMPWSLEAIA